MEAGFDGALHFGSEVFEEGDHGVRGGEVGVLDPDTAAMPRDASEMSEPGVIMMGDSLTRNKHAVEFCFH